ncbi:MAG: C10 family peptidase [Thermodesulfobacteriota bacterium]
MSRPFTLFVVLSLLLHALPAAAVDTATARKAADNFLLFKHSDRQVAALTPLRGNRLAPGSAAVEIGHLASLTGGGYLLIASQEDAQPIKGYSLSRDFSELPPAYRDFLLAEMEWRVRAAATTRQPAAVTRNSAWDFLLTFDQRRTPLAYVADTWLLDSRWGQGYPYNKFLPTMSGQHVLAGCVNIAMGQLMRYHGWPAAGSGVATHDWNGQALTAILHHGYNWGRMPAALDGTQTGVEEDETARLIADLGVSNRTAFGLDNSGTAINPQTLMEQFGYATGIGTVSNFTTSGQPDAAFFPTMQAEINAGRPLLLSLPGHMGVVDGYGSDPTGDKIHINLGWDGIDDNFYYLEKPIIAGGLIFSGGGNTPPVLVAYTGIKPCSGADCAAGVEQPGSLAFPSISGSFDYPHDIDWYSVHLQGNVALSGSRGFTNQAFFISLYDRDWRFLTGTRGNENETWPPTNLPADLYRLRISLVGESGTAWQPGGLPDYQVTITGSQPDAATRQAIDAGLDHPPVILTSFPDRVLKAPAAQPLQLLVDARDMENDPVTLSVASTNPTAISATIQGDILAVQPLAPGQAAIVTVTAQAGGKKATASFTVLTSAQDVAFGTTFTVSGQFTTQNQLDHHPVVLDGSCTISGTRGYSNQAFYLGVNDAGALPVITPTDDPVNDGQFPAGFTTGLYDLTASLRNGNVYYPFTAGDHTAYTITASCPSAAVDIQSLAVLLGVDPAGLSPAGDLNGDGTFNLLDVLRLLAALSGDVTGTLIIDRGDGNGNAVLDSGDAVILLQRLATP